MKRLLLAVTALAIVGCSDVETPSAPALPVHAWHTKAIQWQPSHKPYHVKVVQDSAGVVRTLDVECRSGYSVATGKCLDEGE